MKKILGLTAIGAFLVANIAIVFYEPTDALAEGVKGLQGTYRGNPICHCPDDKNNCTCQLYFEP